MASKSRAAMLQIEAEIIGHIAQNGPITAHRIHEDLGLVLSTCQTITKGLVVEGRLDCVEKHRMKLLSVPKSAPATTTQTATSAPKMVSHGRGRA